MRAVVIREFGPPAVLEPAEIAEVQAGPDEVVIDVALANVTFVETQVRAGKPPHPSMLPALPAILGNGVGGIVVDAGDGVDRTLLGKRVVSGLSGTGGYAERAVAGAEALIEIPRELAVATCRSFTPVGLAAVMLLAGTAIVQAASLVGGLPGLEARILDPGGHPPPASPPIR